MREWLAILAIAPLIAAAPVHAQMKGLSPGDIASVARTRTIDLRLSQEIGPQRPLPLMRGMIIRHDFAPNATVGIGLANIYSKRSGSDLRLGERPSRSKKPALTFVLKF